MQRATYIKELMTTGISFKPVYEDYAVQTLNPNMPNYNPAAAIILHNHNKGNVIKKKVVKNGGRYYLTKSEAAAITSIETWFSKQSIVTDTNCIVTSAGSSYDFEYFNEFAYFTGISVLGNTIGTTYMSNYGFNECSKLKEITLPTSLTTIYGSDNISQYSAFAKCTSLKVINGWSNVTSVSGHGIFISSGLESIDLSNITTIPDDFVRGCNYLKTITFNANTTSIGNSAFYGIGSLATYNDANDGFVLNLPQLSAIGYYAFKNCSALTDIQDLGTITSTYVSQINNAGVFESCNRLRTVDVSNLITIGPKTFYNCSILNTATFGNNLTSVMDSAFMNCGKLQLTSIPTSITRLGYYCFYKVGAGLLNPIKINVNLPNLTSIDYNASCFYQCYCIKNVSLGNVASIPFKSMFENSFLEFIEISPSTTYIGERTFYNTTAIIHLLSETPPTIVYPLSVVPASGNCAKYYVGDGSSAAHDNAILQTYLADTEWNKQAAALNTWYNYLNS